MILAPKNEAAQWYYDTDDPDQAAVVTSIRGRCFIADENGRVLHESDAYHDLGMDSYSQTRSLIREALSSPDVFRTSRVDRRHGHLIRAGVIFDEHHRSP